MSNQTSTRDTIFQLLTDVAPEVDSLDDIDPTANLREQIDLDSMDFLNLIESICTQLNIEIPENDYRQLASFSNIVDYVANLQHS